MNGKENGPNDVLVLVLLLQESLVLLFQGLGVHGGGGGGGSGLGAEIETMMNAWEINFSVLSTFTKLRK